MTRMVEPQANIERMSEEEGTTDRHDMREMERGAKTKKPTGESHLSTRVRVRQRIRRWGGYLYNIDLFPYIEHRLLAFIKGDSGRQSCPTSPLTKRTCRLLLGTPQNSRQYRQSWRA